MPVASHAAKNGSHSPLWMLGSPRYAGISEKHDGAHAARRVALDLGRGELRVPERDEAQRHEPAAARRRTTPRPSSRCTRATHSSASSRSFASRNVCPQNRGKFGNAQRRLRPVRVHVGEARDRVVAAGPHVVVGRRRHRHVVRGRDPTPRPRASATGTGRRTPSSRRAGRRCRAARRSARPTAPARRPAAARRAARRRGASPAAATPTATAARSRGRRR